MYEKFVEMASEKNKLESEIAELKKVISEMITDHAALLSEISKNTDKNNEILSQIGAQNASLKEKKETYDSLDVAHKEKKSMSDYLDKSKVEKLAEIAALNASIRHLTSILPELTLKINTLKEDIKNTAKASKEKEDEILSKLSRLSLAENRIDEKTRKLQEIQKNFTPEHLGHLGLN